MTYARVLSVDLFNTVPFRTDPQTHATNVMNVFGVVVMGLGNVGALVPAITTLCENHVRYGVQLADYTTLSIAVSSSFRQVCRILSYCKAHERGVRDACLVIIRQVVARGFWLACQRIFGYYPVLIDWL